MKNFEGMTLLRAISIVGIVICHVCLQLRMEPPGRFSGFLFVQIFLFMSAYLLGLSGGGKSNDWKRFLFKRWKRLSAVYYPFLVIATAILLMAGQEVTTKNILTHFTYTNYILKDSICGVSFGHLWYLSMTMLCYAGVAALRSKWAWCHKWLRGYGLAGTVMLGILCGAALQHLGTSSRVVFLFFSYLLVYEHADSIRRFAVKQTGRMAWFVFVACNVICFTLFFVPGFYDMLMTRDIVIIVTAMAWMCLFIKYSDHIVCNKAVNYISAISFEIYLVHQPFIFGQFSLIGKCGLGTAAEIGIAVGITIVLAATLNAGCKRIKNDTTKKFENRITR